MSFFSGGKSKDKENMKKSQFYVEFLGWMECRGLRGQRYTEPVIRELRRRHRKTDAPPKLTIQVSKKDLKITQEVEEKPKKGIKKIKFPLIPARDVTFVHQATLSDGRLDDIVACIYLGYMPRTQKYVHVHVYRFDEASTASLFTSQMALIVEENAAHIREVEISLANEGEIDNPKLTLPEESRETYPTDSAVGSASSGNSDESPTFRNREIDADLESLIDVQPFDSVTDELKHRLQIRDTPLLLPPKDYDTISRARGNLEERNKRRCLNENIVGALAVSRDRNGSNESGVDVASPEGDADEREDKLSTDKAFLNKADWNSPIVSPRQKHRSLPLNDAKNSPQVAHKPLKVDSPQVAHKPVRVNSPQVAHKPIKIDSLQVAPKAVRPDSIFPQTGFNPDNTSPEIEQQPSPSFVYPPKVTNSPMSPRMFPQPLKQNLSRQSSQNSFHSESPKVSQRSDEGRTGQQIHHLRYGSNDDIYAIPAKASRQVPMTDELPPDYFDDDEPQQLRTRQPFVDPYLDRSLPTDLLRSKLNPNRSRPNSEDLRPSSWAESPVLMKGQGTAPQGNRGMYSPQIERHGSSKR